jgi:DNA-binding MarR family transcriptional regulator
MQDDSATSPLRDSLPHAVVRAFRLVNRTSNRLFKPLGLSAEQAHVLSILWTTGPSTVGALQRELALSSPTLTGAIDRMEAQELVSRTPSPTDARAWLLAPSAGAARKRKKVDAVVAQIDAVCFGSLTANERGQLAQLLDKVCTAMAAAKS